MYFENMLKTIYLFMNLRILHCSEVSIAHVSILTNYVTLKNELVTTSFLDCSSPFAKSQDSNVQATSAPLT